MNPFTRSRRRRRRRCIHWRISTSFTVLIEGWNSLFRSLGKKKQKKKLQPATILYQQRRRLLHLGLFSHTGLTKAATEPQTSNVWSAIKRLQCWDRCQTDLRRMNVLGAMLVFHLVPFHVLQDGSQVPPCQSVFNSWQSIHKYPVTINILYTMTQENCRTNDPIL